MTRCQLIIPLFWCLALSPALAQDLSGAWLLEDGGMVRLEADGSGGYRYERHTRTDLDATPDVERGTGALAGGELTTEETLGAGMTGVLSPRAPRAPWVGRYTLDASAETLRGERTLAGQRVTETLRRVEERVAGNDVRLLIDSEGWAQVREDMRQATSSIDLQTYTYADDATGRSIADVLMAKARQGLRVRVLVDAQSKVVIKLLGHDVPDISDGLDDELRAAGVEVIIQHRAGEAILGSLENSGRSILGRLGRLVGRPPAPRERRGWFDHDHRKITLVDNQVGFLGGQNVAHEYEHVWHDVQARIQGPAVQAIQAMFVERWNAAGGAGVVEPAPAGAAWAGDIPVEVLGRIPGLGDPIRARYLQEIAAADQRVLVEMAFLADDGYIGALMSAAQRGVRTVVIIPAPQHNANVVTAAAFRWVQNDVVRSGVELYHFQPAMVHAKLAVFDGEVATLGSANMSGTSLAEINAWIPDPRFARLMEERLFRVDLPRCDRVAIERLTLRQRLTSRLARFVQSVL
jgi:phosphatidylserine/phosphatidylglycerophosphate/cardiolipin synthase-like enzyme